MQMNPQNLSEPTLVVNTRAWFDRVYMYYMKSSGAKQPRNETLCHYFWTIVLYAPIVWFFNHPIKIPSNNKHVKELMPEVWPVTIAFMLASVFLFVGCFTYFPWPYSIINAALLLFLPVAGVIFATLLVNHEKTKSPTFKDNVFDWVVYTVSPLFVAPLFYLVGIAMLLERVGFWDGVRSAVGGLENWFNKSFVLFNKWRVKNYVLILAVLAGAFGIWQPASFFMIVALIAGTFVILVVAVIILGLMIKFIFEPVENFFKRLKNKPVEESASFVDVVWRFGKSTYRHMCPYIIRKDPNTTELV